MVNDGQETRASRVLNLGGEFFLRGPVNDQAGTVERYQWAALRILRTVSAVHPDALKIRDSQNGGHDSFELGGQLQDDPVKPGRYVRNSGHLDSTRPEGILQHMAEVFPVDQELAQGTIRPCLSADQCQH